jgi:glycosyltransferase involved in cell wall biosynthesis
VFSFLPTAFERAVATTVVMLVSIVINNYNYASYLASAITSALEQTYQPLQVIVVDDGSTDASRKVISQFSNRIQTVLKPNGGQGSALNAGFRLCHGTIVIFLDSDDTLKPDAVAKVVSRWEYRFSKIQYPLEVVDDDGSNTGQIYPSNPLSSGNLIPSLLTSGSYGSAPTSGNAFAYAFLNKVMPIPETAWPSHADCYLIHLAPFYGLVATIGEPLGSYRVYAKSLSLSGIVVDGQVRVGKLRGELLRDLAQQKLIENHCALFGYTMNDTVMTDRYSHYKIRLASLKSAPDEHPFREDRLYAVALGLISRVWKDPDLLFVKRILLTTWAVALSFLPRTFCKELIAQAIASPSRRRSIARVVRSGA